MTRFSVTVPQTDYVLAAAIMATALSSPEDNGDGRAAVERVATEKVSLHGRDARS